MGTPANDGRAYKVEKSEAEWQAELSPEQYQVLREAAPAPGRENAAAEPQGVRSLS